MLHIYYGVRRCGAVRGTHVWRPTYYLLPTAGCGGAVVRGIVHATYLLRGAAVRCGAGHTRVAACGAPHTTLDYILHYILPKGNRHTCGGVRCASHYP
jgi:hypothetical protein